MVAIVETARGPRAARTRRLRTRGSRLPDARRRRPRPRRSGSSRRPDGLELLHRPLELVLASAAAGLRGPVDRVWVDVRDDERPRGEDCALARSLGFRGKACIHPDQVEIVNAGFAPTEGELAQAQADRRRLRAGGGRRRGAVALDGEMIDLPVVERAEQLLADDEEEVCCMETDIAPPRRRNGAAASTRTSTSATSSGAGSGARSPRPTTSGSPV